MPPAPQFDLTNNRPASSRKKFYAVVFPTGRSCIVTTWKECANIVLGQRNVRYKKLVSLAEAKEYINNFTHAPPFTPPPAPYVKKNIKQLPAKFTFTPQHKWKIYTDGTSSPNIPYTAWGWCLVRDDAALIGECVGFLPRTSSANIDAELAAVLAAIQMLQQYHYFTPQKNSAVKPSARTKHNLTICYDYAGIEKWAQGEWKAKAPVAINYVKAIFPYTQALCFQKISAHGANKWNDHVDKLVRWQLQEKWEREKSSLRPQHPPRTP